MTSGSVSALPVIELKRSSGTPALPRRSRTAEARPTESAQGLPGATVPGLCAAVWPVIAIFDRPTAPPLPLQFARPDTCDEIIGLGALIAATAKREQAATVLLLVPATTDDGEEVIVASAHAVLDTKIRIARVHRSEAAPPTIGAWFSPREFDGLGDWYVAQYFRLVVAL